jgi:6-pyruvoyltetrahydropterin/6-carboxytetrahydropterin synthase
VFQVRKAFSFEASHRLPKHDGRCSNFHGHSYRGWLVAEAERLQTEGPKTGMVVDYCDLAAAIQPLLDEFLDHHDLNETLGFENTTAERIAQWIFNKVKPKVWELTAVIIEETRSSAVEYRP